MRATEFEFRRRFWIIAAIFFLGFFLFQSDVDVITTVRHLVAPTAPTGPQAVLATRCLIGFGALLLFVAAWLRTWSTAYLRTDVVHDSSQHSEALLADGPFRYVRNPLYIGNVLMAVGIGLLASWPGFVFIVVGNWFFVYRLVFREEAALRIAQGESYRAYCRAVPRFWPTLRPRVPSGETTPRWGQAFVGEAFVWLFALAELCLALTLNGKFVAIGFGLGFFAYFIVLARIRWKAA